LPLPYLPACLPPPARLQNSDEGKAYTDLAKRVDEAISFMNACGLDMNSAVMNQTEFYVSHEVGGLVRGGWVGSWVHPGRLAAGQWLLSFSPPALVVPPPTLTPANTLQLLSFPPCPALPQCLLLDYEEALTREDSTTGLWYGCSGHFLWCGERTRQLDNAHVEFLRGIGNPIGVKVRGGAGARCRGWEGAGRVCLCVGKQRGRQLATAGWQTRLGGW
jgi:hypothetical protein